MLIKEIKDNAQLLWKQVNANLDFYKELHLPVYQLAMWEYEKLNRAEFNKLRPQFKKIDDKFTSSILNRYEDYETLPNHVLLNINIISDLKHKITLLGMLDDKKFSKEVLSLKTLQNPLN